MNIKQHPLYFVLIVALSLGYSSCTRYEVEPIHNRTEDLIFDEMDQNAFFAEQVLNNVFTYLPSTFNRIGNSFLDAATDDAILSLNGHNIEILSQARQSPVQTIDDLWPTAYEGIRRANIFLAKIDRVPIGQDVTTRWKAEARFVRAMLYFELSKRYGGVPLLGDRILQLSDDLNIPRDSYDDCVRYIINECDAISALLPSDPLTGNQVGRISQGAALSLKSRALLYAASPLHNPSNSVDKWQQAFDAAEDVIGLGVYSLINNRINLFLQRQNTEIILAYQRMQSSDVERQHAPVGYTAPNASAGLTSPTQNLVDAFGMANGLPITDPESGYDPGNPYDNRDPRLGHTVFYNGSRWLSRDVETFDGGRDRPGGVITQTRSGYYLRKFMGNFAENTDYSNVHHNPVIFRYAEILLNYAEAANEIGLTDIAYEQLLVIRGRGSGQGLIPPGENGLRGLKPDMSQAEMRAAIQLERRLELAFEEHRFWDVRRWKLAETLFNQPLNGIRITESEDGLNYAVEPVATISFAHPQMYLYPIPHDEVLKNSAMDQNPGW